MDSTILSSGGFRPTTIDTPLDARTRVQTREELETIDNPYVGMQVYIVNEGVRVEVKGLKDKVIGGVNIQGASIDTEQVENIVTSPLEKRTTYDSETETLHIS